MKKVMALLILLAATAAAPAQYNHDGYRLAHDGYYYYGNDHQPYYRSLITVPGYTDYYGRYYGGYSYYKYHAYYPQQTYTPPSYTPPAVPAYSADWRQKLLENAKAMQDGKEYLDALKILYPQGIPPALLPAPPPGPSPGYYPPSYSGHYYQYTLPAAASTQYGYQYSYNAVKPPEMDINQAIQYYAQAVQFSQKLGGDSVEGFRALLAQQGSANADVARIIAHRDLGVALIKAMGTAPAAQYQGYEFKVTPGKGVEKTETKELDAGIKTAVIARWKASALESCAACHSGSKAKGGFDVIRDYPTLNKQEKQYVLSLITMTPDNPDYQKKFMPRSPDGGPGTPIPPEKMRDWFAY